MVMKKFIFVILTLGLITYLVGCGNRQQPISETQEPISIEELSRLNTSEQLTPEMATKTAPEVTVTTSSAVSPAEMKALGVKLEQLPPSGPYPPPTREIQAALKNAGFYTGIIDGKKGPLTKKAVEDFQKTNGLDADGKVGPKTWAVLSQYLNPEPTPPVSAKKKR